MKIEKTSAGDTEDLIYRVTSKRNGRVIYHKSLYANGSASGWSLPEAERRKSRNGETCF